MSHKPNAQRAAFKKADHYNPEENNVDALLEKLANPNNCATCDHKKCNPDGGWCYMFRDAPAYVCMRHTARS